MTTYTTKWHGTRTGITIASGGTLTVASGGTFNCTGYTAAGTIASITTTANGVIGGNLAVTGSTSLAAGNLTCDTSGNTVIAGTLTVTGLATLNGGLTLTGAPVVTWSNNAANYCVVATYSGDAAKWTTGAPTFVNAHPYIKLTCNSTVYRIPVFKDV